MQLGIRLHDVASGSLEERLAIAQQQGFKCAHLALTKVLKDYPGDVALTPGMAMYLKRLFGKHEIDVAVLGNYKNLGNPDPVQLQAIQASYYANIRFAAQLGAGVVGTETGAPNTSYTEDTPESKTEEALGMFIHNLRPVVACAEKFGVIVAIEPVCRHIVYDSKRALAVLRAIDSPNLQIILDPVNLLGPHNVADCQTVIRTAIEDLSDYIAVVHLKDYVMSEDGQKLISVACGTGKMDYTDILHYIKTGSPISMRRWKIRCRQMRRAARSFIEEAYAKA
jgi:sugar phosphate isomerase/epimerase